MPFLLAQLETYQFEFSIQLITAVKKQEDIVSLLRFLHYPKCLNEQDDLFPMPSKKVMQKMAKELLHRMFLNHSDQDDICKVVSDQNTRKIVQGKTISEKFCSADHSTNFCNELFLLLDYLLQSYVVV